MANWLKTKNLLFTALAVDIDAREYFKNLHVLQALVTESTESFPVDLEENILMTIKPIKSRSYKNINFRSRIPNIISIASAVILLIICSLFFLELKDYKSQIASISDQLKEQKETILMAGEGARADRLHQFLSDHETFSEIFPSHLLAGFEYPSAGLLIVGTHDIFGIDRPMRRKKSQGVHIDLFSDLVPGEMVVHDQHGIGRYDGMVNLEAGGARRDYLKITYASEDSLYISMEHLDQIQKYVGSEGRAPKLSRLGGQEWNRMKEKARTSR